MPLRYSIGDPSTNPPKPPKPMFQLSGFPLGSSRGLKPSCDFFLVQVVLGPDLRILSHCLELKGFRGLGIRDD